MHGGSLPKADVCGTEHRFNAQEWRHPVRNEIPAEGGATEPSYVELLDRVDRLAMLLDSRYRIPFTRIHFGWDAIGSIVPVAGDLATLIASVYLVRCARRLGADGKASRRMVLNVALDAAFGAIPIAGTVFDVFFRANERNLKLLIDHIEHRRGAAGP